MNRLMAWLARIALGKHIVKGLAWAHNSLDGKRSEISLALLIVVHALKVVGIIPAEAAGQIELVLGGLLPLTLADKASKAFQIVDKLTPKQEAPKSE